MATHGDTAIEAQQLAALARSNPDYFYGRTAPPHNMFRDSRGPPPVNETRYPFSGPQLPSSSEGVSALGSSPSSPPLPALMPHPPDVTLPGRPPIPAIPTSATEAQKIWTFEKNRSTLVKQFVRFILNSYPDDDALARAEMIMAEEQKRMKKVMHNLNASGFISVD